MAIPPVLAGRIEFEPDLPPARDQLTQRMPMGSVIKCMAVYDEPFWRADGLTGQMTDVAGPAQLTFDNSPPSGSPGILLAFVEGEHARELSRSSHDERRRQVVACLVRCFGRRPSSRRSSWSSTGPPRGSRGVATGRTSRRGCSRRTVRRFANRAVWSTGQARRRPRSGPGTWTGLCVRGSPQHAKSSPLSALRAAAAFVSVRGRR